LCYENDEVVARHFLFCCSLFADGVLSEILLIHPDDLNWFITMDETHHEFTMEGYKGRGLTTIHYGNNALNRKHIQLAFMGLWWLAKLYLHYISSAHPLKMKPIFA
jgi:hypothetical protein